MPDSAARHRVPEVSAFNRKEEMDGFVSASIATTPAKQNCMRTYPHTGVRPVWLGLLVLFGAIQLGAESIPLTNSGFESIAIVNPLQDPVHFTGDGKLIVGAYTQPTNAPLNSLAVQLPEPVAGWMTAGQCGTIALGGQFPAPEGRNTAYVEPLGTLSQIPTPALRGGTIYQIEADIAGSIGTGAQSYAISLVAEGGVIATSTSVATTGSFLHVVRSFTVPAESPYAGKPFGVSIGNVTASAGRLFIDNVRLSAQPIPTPVPIPSGALGWWRGSSTTNEITRDSGSFRSGATTGPGFLGNGFVFQGGLSAMVLPTTFSVPSQEFSVECWIQRTSTSLAGTDFEAGEFFGGSDLGFTFGLTHEGRLYLSHIGVVSFYSTTHLADRAWHHVGVVRRGGILEFYADGLLTDRVPCTVNFRLSGPYAIGGLGTPYFGAAYGFLGAIDELTAYGRALSASEMQSIAAAGTAGKVPLEAGFGVLPVPSTLIGGTPWSFGASLTNTGATLWTNVLVSARFPSDSGILAAAASSGTPTVDGSTVKVELPELAPGGVVSLSVETQAGRSKGGFVTNHFEAQFVEKTLGRIAIPVDQVVSIASTAVPVPAGAVAWWRLNGGAADDFGRSSGLVSGHAGFAPGIVRQGLVLDGVDSSIQLGLAPALQLGDLTVEGWIRRTNTSAISQVSFSTGAIFGGGLGSYGLTLSSGGSLQFGRVGSTGVSSANLITDTEWHHVAASKTGNQVALYVDGVAAGSGVVPAGSVFGTPFAIGALGQSVAGLGIAPFWGAIDELTIYNRPLSKDEIASVARAGLSGKAVGVVTFSESVSTPSPIRVGTEFNYRIAVTNHSGSSVDGLLLRQPLPKGWSLKRSATSRGTLTQAEGLIRWKPGFLDSEESATVDLSLIPGEAGEVQLVGTLFGAPGDPLVQTLGAKAIILPVAALTPPGVIGLPLERPSIVNLEVSLTPGWDSAVQVDYSILADTAVEGRDFVGGSGTLEFPPGATSRVVPLQLLPGSSPVRDLGVIIQLSNARGAAIDQPSARIALRGEPAAMASGVDAAGKPAFRVHMLAGRRYELQRSASLDQAEWTFVAEAIVNFGEQDTVFSDPQYGDQPNVFYRLIVSQR